MTTVIEAIVSVWDSIMNAIVNLMASAQGLFWADGALTFLGTLAVIGVAISFVLLVINIIQNFLHLRG